MVNDKQINQMLALITVISFIVAIMSFLHAVHTSNEASNDLAELNEKLNLTKNELNKTRIELIDVGIELVKINNEFQSYSSANTKEILLAIYEVDSIGLNNESRDKFFQTKFGFSYKKALNILEYSSKTDDNELAFSNLIHGDYSSSLYHFDLALIKSPSNNESKIGKSAALIGLNRSSESIEILLELENDYENNKLIYKLLGDSYYIENNYSKAVDYYIKAFGLYLTEEGIDDKDTMSLSMLICEIEANGIFDSPYISITNLNDGSKRASIILEDFGWVYETKYRITY